MKKNAQKLLSAILCLTLSFGIFSCSGNNGTPSDTSSDTAADVTASESATGENTTVPSDPTGESTTGGESEAPKPEKVDLDGKKILIIGNSYVYYGRSVIHKGTSVRDQASRSGDKGYFYQLCRENGYNVSVTNWTFGGHGLSDFCDEPCSHSSCSDGVIHMNYLTDPAFDYVLISPGGGDRSEKNIKSNFDYLINFFKTANPDVKIVCLGNLAPYGYSSFGTVEPGIYTYYKTLEEKGVIMADWGGLVNGIIEGKYTVGGEQTFSKKTFIVKDGYHPSPLAGYITTLMAYCAITGESALGQEYSFCYNKSLNSKYDMEEFISDYYVNGNTNFLDVMKSDADMTGIQRLVDEYLAAKPYLTNEAPSFSTVMLKDRPTENLISVLFRDSATTGDGWMTYKKDATKTFSGIRGDNDKIASPLIGKGTLTEAQKTDIADIGYGVSIIGISHIDDTKSGAYGTSTAAGTTNAVWNLVNGHWGSTIMAAMYFDADTYNVNGEKDKGGAYTALITLNFGEIKKFSAIGYSSGNLKGFPQAHDIYVSDDGVNWTKIESACYDARNIAPESVSSTNNPDPWRSNTGAVEVLFDMGGVTGKYIRIGVISGGDMDNDLGLEQINTREIMVYGE